MPNHNDKFSVKSAWEIFRQRKDKKENIMCIWEKGIPFRISFLLWRILLQRTHIGEVLVNIKATNSFICCSCNDNC
ncbi:hypothetical protein R3W88_033137 [Solanum pinnatisectum]|uniref:Reverse transcriptase zinc-binding domain-containing protein n=1 Tax=Solanum pinnatisectum TaxID=50273 RepID=A0AAV9K1Z3_9SOLN|nr:hypothetical protein R3W88_033137 [Solanum pinnatisectum]